MKIEKSENVYRANFTKPSSYDYLQVTEDALTGDIKVEFLDTRWRSRKDTVTMFQECINAINSIPPLKK